MKSYDNAQSFEHTRHEEWIEERNSWIIHKWKASLMLDMAASMASDLEDGEYLTTDMLKEIREEVDKLAQVSRDQIIREWEITQATEGVE